MYYQRDLATASQINIYEMVISGTATLQHIYSDCFDRIAQVYF